jgi:hypothetical protein
MRKHQRGVTFIGWLFLLIPIAIVGYAGIRLAPLYLNYMKVSRALTQVATEYKGDDQINAAAVRNSIDKRYNIDSIDYPPINTIKIAREGKTWVLESNYEDVVPMFAGVSLLVKFEKRATID